MLATWQSHEMGEASLITDVGGSISRFGHPVAI